MVSLGDKLAGKTVLNKYSLFVSDIHRCVRNKSAADALNAMAQKASLIAAFSSSHSWKTYEYLSGKGTLDKDAIAEEQKRAFEKGWMEINEDDIEEVMALDINDYSLSMWLFYTIDKEKRGDYARIFKQIKMEFAFGLEPVERTVD